MTDWHCPLCQRYVRVYFDARDVACPTCRGDLRRGRGTRLDRREVRDPNEDDRSRGRPQGRP